MHDVQYVEELSWQRLGSVHFIESCVCGVWLQGLSDQPFEIRRPLERKGSGRSIPALGFELSRFAFMCRMRQRNDQFLSLKPWLQLPQNLQLERLRLQQNLRTVLSFVADVNS
jgi:hypothetical protein